MFDSDTISNTPGGTNPPTPIPADQKSQASPLTQDSSAQNPQSAQADTFKQSGPQQSVSNTPAPPQDPNANHPLVVRAGVTNAVARALAGNPTRTVIDADGNRRTEPVPLTKSHIAMALAMEAISGSLTGLTAGRGRGIGAAGAAAFQQSANQRLQAQQAQDQQAQEDANNRANALTRKAQAAELNSRILLSTAEAESRGAETLQKIADTNKQLISDYEDKNALMARGVTQQELLEGMKSGKYDSTSAIGPIDGYRLVGDGRVEATHSIVFNPSAKVTLTPEQFEDYAANHVPGFPKGVKILSTQVSGATIARANEQKSAFMLAQARHDEVAKALSESDDPKVKALAAKVPSIGSLLDDPKTSPGLITALQRYQKYVSHSDFSHGGDLYDSLRMMAAPSKPDGKGSFVPNGDQKYADQVANAFGGWDVLEKYHEAVKPLEIKNENDASDMLASSEPGSRSYKYAKRWLSANAQAKAATASAEARAREQAAQPDNLSENEIVNGMLDGSVDITKTASIRSNQRERYIALAKQKDPSFNMSTYGLRLKMNESYTSGKQGDQIQSFNTFMQHAADASDVTNEYRQTRSPLINKSLNWMSKNATGDPGYARFVAALEPVRKEFATFLEGGHALTESDKHAANTILSDDSSPAQIQAALKQMAHTGSIRLGSLDDRYKATFGHSYQGLLYPDTVSAAQKLGLGDFAAKYSAGKQGSPATALNTQNQLTNLQVNPQTGQQIGWNGSAWVDAKTGQAVK
jgi:hypothetical protein